MRYMTIIALAVGGFAAPSMAQQSPLTPILGQMCVGNIGITMPIRIFVQPVTTTTVDFWSDNAKDANPEPAGYFYGGRLALSEASGGYTFSTSKNTTFRFVVSGSRLIGKAADTHGWKYDVDLACHPSTTHHA